MKCRVAGIVCAFALVAFCRGSAAADAFERYGLRPAAVIVLDGDEESYELVRERAEELGARGLLGVVPTLVFGRFPPATSAADFTGLRVRFAFSAGEIDPFGIDVVTLRSARVLLESERILRERAPLPAEPFEDLVLRVPPEVVERTRIPGPRLGAPSQIAERAVDQNSEFMIGSVLINVVLPESDGGSESWTDQEIASLLSDINLGLDQYIQKTHWVNPPGLSFTVNCPGSHRRVLVSSEPIEMGKISDHGIWITEAMRALGVDHTKYSGAHEMTHAYNNETRIARGTDWVFMAFIVDASENGCWIRKPGDPNYVAYAYLGGPYIVVPYPACRFGTGINFAHVFIHEMSHVFWALDEYASAGASCYDRSGYLDYRNGNSYYQECGEGLACIMNNAELSAPLPICTYTMGQVGLADDNNNSKPDLYEMPPQIEFFQMPTQSDTTYDGKFLVGARFWNDAVRNRNQYIPAERRVSYAPKLTAGWMRINRGFWATFNPAGGKWNSSEAEIGMIMDGDFDPGENWIHFRVRNIVGLEAHDSTRVIFIGIKYYENLAFVEPGAIRLRWKTAREVFGADFEIHREDLTARGTNEVIDTVFGDAPVEVGSERNVYTYLDEAVEAGHEYRYRLVARIQGREYASREMVKTAAIPFAGKLVSPLAPNPTGEGGTKFSIRVPRSYYDPSGSQTVTTQEFYGAPSLQEVKTPVEVDVFDASGRKVRTVYSLSVYGGEDLTLTWDGLNDRGGAVAAGVYFIRVRAGSMQEVRKAVVLR